MTRSIYSLVFDVIVGVLLAGAIVIVLGAHAPTIEVKANGDTIIVRFERGATHACTVFRMAEPSYAPGEDPNFPDGHYSPRSCSILSREAAGYVDHFSEYIFNPKTGKAYDADWDIYAEVWYEDEKPLETNRVRVHR